MQQNELSNKQEDRLKDLSKNSRVKLINNINNINHIEVDVINHIKSSGYQITEMNTD